MRACSDHRALLVASEWLINPLLRLCALVRAAQCAISQLPVSRVKALNRCREEDCSPDPEETGNRSLVSPVC